MKKFVDSHVHIGRFELEYYYGMTSTIEDVERIYEKNCIFAMPASAKGNATVCKQLEKSDLNYRFFAWINNIDDLPDSGVDGIKLHPTIGNMCANGAEYKKIYQYASDKNLPIIIHTSRDERSKYKLVAEMAIEYPDVKFIAAHLGGKNIQDQMEFPKLIQKIPNLYADISSKYLLMTVENAIKMAEDKILFASDYPQTHPDVFGAVLDHCNITDEQKKKVLYKNAKSIFPDLKV